MPGARAVLPMKVVLAEEARKGLIESNAEQDPGYPVGSRERRIQERQPGETFASP